MKEELREDEFIKVRLAAKLLTQELHKHITIPVLSDMVNLPEKKLKAGFMQLYGKGVYGYLKVTRLTKAKEMLLKKRLPVHKIALMIGFQNKNSFINSFRKEFNVSPGKWRRQQKKDNLE